MKFDDLNLKEYEILERLGGNTLFTSYLARQVNLGRYVVIRLLATQITEATQRFQNEIVALSSLQHPHNCTVIDAGAADIGGVHGPYVVMEYILGDTLHEHLRREGRLAPARVLNLARQLLGALAEGHRNGLMHRQISPHTILLAEHDAVTEHATLIDYGLEQALHPAHWLRALSAEAERLPFLAPELLAAEPPTVRSDLYALGMVLRVCLFGQVRECSYRAEELSDSARDLWERLVETVAVAWAPEPERRYHTALEFLDAFDTAVAAVDITDTFAGIQRRHSSGRMGAVAAPESHGGGVSENPSIWILSGDPAVDQVFIERVRTVASHYDIIEISRDDAAREAKALLAGEVQPPWLVLFGDLHVIVQSRVLHALRDMPASQRLLISAKLNGQMLEAAVNFCGVDKHMVLPVDVVSLSEALEARVADCRRQLLRQQIQGAVPQQGSESGKPRYSITGEFAARTR